MTDWGNSVHRELIAARALMLGMVLQACSRDANVHLDDGSVVTGEILASNKLQLSIDALTGKKVPTAPGSWWRWTNERKTRLVNRADVECIDHPGTVAMIALGALALGGAGLTVTGILLAQSADAAGGDWEEFNVGLAAALAGYGGVAFVGGTIGFAWGLSTWLDSTQAAEGDASEAQLPTTPAPNANVRLSF